MKRQTRRTSNSSLEHVSSFWPIRRFALAALTLMLLTLQFQPVDGLLSCHPESRVRPWGVGMVDRQEKTRKRTSDQKQFVESEPASRSSTARRVEKEKKRRKTPAPTEAKSSSILQAKHLTPRIIIMGGPASGKGTQCEWISSKYNLVHLSTGEILREAVANGHGDGVGAVAKLYMDAGKLVPDDIMIRVVKDRLAQPDCRERGWILDGFPRTRAQAEALVSMGITADIFLFLNVPDDVLVERISGRRTDPVTGKIYHMKFNPPPLDDAELVKRLKQRSDDTVEKVRNRLKQFHENVSSVRQCYEDILVEIDGTGSPEEVAKEIGRVIDVQKLVRDITASALQKMRVHQS